MARHQRTQRPPVANIRAVLDRDQARDLLVKLGVNLVFCFPPNELERIIGEPPLTVYDFTDAVFAREGLDPATADKNLVNHVRTVAADAFAKCDPPKI
jgi:hypothetical protein